MVENRPQVGDHFTDHGGFVVGGDDDPDVRVAGVDALKIHVRGPEAVVPGRSA
jgi:hypothetical protein